MIKPPVVLAMLACAAALTAQAPKASDFFLDDYRNVIQLDMAKVRSSGVWDEMGSSALKLLIGTMQDELGFSLDQLDRVTAMHEPILDNGAVVGSREVVTIEGNDDLGAPTDRFGSRYREQRLGAYTLLHDEWTEGEAAVLVHPRLRVSGPTALLTEVLQGKPRAGLPSGDVMAFVAGRKDLLLHFVLDVRQHDEPRRVLHEVLPDAGWPEDDHPTLIGGRVLVAGDEDDPHLTLELVIRHGKDGPGLIATQQAMAACLDRLSKMPEARLFRPLLRRVEHERDGTDAVWRVDLGRARDAGGMLGTLMPFLFVARSVEAQAQLAPVEVVVEEAEPVEPDKPEPKKPEPKKGGGK